MTAQGFAEWLPGRRVRPRRCVAKCPSHRDRSPSLSICECQGGCVLVRCFAGCTHTAILAALGLVSRDLYVGTPIPRRRKRPVKPLRSAQSAP